MATLLNLQTNEKIVLLVQHFFGRQLGVANTVLKGLDVSRVHALIFWDGSSWLLQDSSTNGTFVNQAQVASGCKIVLHQGDNIQFGNLNAGLWQLLEAEEPKSMLVPLTPGIELVELDSIIVLPSVEMPEISIYLDNNGQWVCESTSGVSVLTTGDHVGTHDKIWRFVEVEHSKKTQMLKESDLTDLSQIKAFFSVSQNEEHVTLRIRVGRYCIDLEERAHHYLSLLLARQRLSDISAGMSVNDQGWVTIDALTKMMKLTDLHINTQVYRIRQQLLMEKPSELMLSHVIERRPGEIRFAYQLIEITGGLSKLPDLVEKYTVKKSA